MGIYRRFHFHAKLRKDTPQAVKDYLRAAILPERPEGHHLFPGYGEPKAPSGHDFFATPTPSSIFHLCNGEDVPDPRYTEYADGNSELEFTAEFKNYSHQMEDFIDWIVPFLRDKLGKRLKGRRKLVIGWCMHNAPSARIALSIDLPSPARPPVIRNDDLTFLMGILPTHYLVQRGKGTRGANRIHCTSLVGIGKATDPSAEDEQQWESLVGAIKGYFGDRLLEIDHNVNYLHTNFYVYLGQGSARELSDLEKSHRIVVRQLLKSFLRDHLDGKWLRTLPMYTYLSWSSQGFYRVAIHGLGVWVNLWPDGSSQIANSSPPFQPGEQLLSLTRLLADLFDLPQGSPWIKRLKTEKAQARTGDWQLPPDITHQS